MGRSARQRLSFVVLCRSSSDAAISAPAPNRLRAQSKLTSLWYCIPVVAPHAGAFWLPQCYAPSLQQMWKTSNVVSSRKRSIFYRNPCGGQRSECSDRTFSKIPRILLPVWCTSFADGVGTLTACPSSASSRARSSHHSFCQLVLSSCS